jgi:hypothetical protein
MMKLYEFAPTRSIRARWVLQELGEEFEAVTVNLAAATTVARNSSRSIPQVGFPC